MIEAWFSSSLMTASSLPSSVSNRPPFASKHDEYRIESSVRKKAGEPSLEVLVDLLGAADEPHARHAVAPAVERLLGRGDDTGVVGEAEVVVRAEIEDLAAARHLDRGLLRRDDHPLGLEEPLRRGSPPAGR